MDDCTESQVKAELMRMNPAVVGTERMVLALINPTQGFVVWDASEDERDKFVEALYTGLAFCGTDTRDEWCVLGRAALVYMRSLPDFKQCDPVECGKLVYIGKLKFISVYTYSQDLETPPLPEKHGEFVVGVRGRAARGIIQGCPLAFTGPNNDDPAEPEECYEEDED